MDEKPKYSWELPVGSDERAAAEHKEAAALGMSRLQYVGLSMDERQRRWLRTTTRPKRETLQEMAARALREMPPILPPPQKPLSEEVTRALLTGQAEGGKELSDLDKRARAAMVAFGQSGKEESPREAVARYLGEPSGESPPPKEPPQSSPSAPESPTDKARITLCEVLALLFALPFGEDLYRGTPINGWHVFYLVIGLLFAVAGPMWPLIKTRVPGWLYSGLGRAASDVRIWISVLLILFVYVVGPDIYRRAMRPVEVTGAIGVMPVGTVCYDGPCPDVHYDGTPLGWMDEPEIRYETGPGGLYGAYNIDSFIVNGKNVGNQEVKLDDAYIVSGVTGDKLQMKIILQGQQTIGLDQINPIPPGAEIHLIAYVNQKGGIPEYDFLKNWATIQFVTSYNGAQVRKSFNNQNIAAAIAKLHPPDAERPMSQRRRTEPSAWLNGSASRFGLLAFSAVF